MDLPTLIKYNVDRLRTSKDQFYATADPGQRKASFDSFIEAITNLHKILKGTDISMAAGSKLRDIITGAAKEAEQMKGHLGGGGGGPSPSPQGPPNHSPSQPGRSASQNRNDKPKNDNDKDKAAFQEALQGAIITEKPNVNWEDVAGLKVAKQTLKEAIIFPTKFPDIFVGLRKPWKGILLYGVTSPAPRYR